MLTIQKKEIYYWPKCLKPYLHCITDAAGSTIIVIYIIIANLLTSLR